MEVLNTNEFMEGLLAGLDPGVLSAWREAVEAEKARLSRTLPIPDAVTLQDRHRLATFAPDDAGEWGETLVGNRKYPVLTREFWTSRQRQASNLHEVSYRACYKPQLPGLFIEKLTQPGDLVYDPFGGRGTTAVEAALRGRRVISNDINPLSRMLAQPRLTLPEPEAVRARLEEIPLSGTATDDLDLTMFYHADTEAEIRALRAYLIERQEGGNEDDLDRWIRMVATNRLTGHSPGFFSVYTLPPNQAASAKRQVLINLKRDQVPPYRSTHALIMKKTRQLLKGITPEERRNLSEAASSARFLTGDARRTPEIPNDTVAPHGDLAAVPRRCAIYTGQLAALLVQRPRFRCHRGGHHDGQDPSDLERGHAGRPPRVIPHHPPRGPCCLRGGGSPWRIGLP